MSLVGGFWEPCTVYSLPCCIDDQTCVDEKCVEFPSLDLDTDFDDDCLGPEIFQNETLGPCWTAVGLDSAGNPVPNGDPIGVWDCTCEPFALLAEADGGIRLEYSGPQPLVNFGKPWRVRIGGMGTINFSLTGDTTDCGTNNLNISINDMNSTTELPGLCLIPFIHNGITINPDPLMFDLTYDQDCCIEQCVIVDPLCHSVCMKTIATPSEISGSNVCEIRWTSVTGQVFNGELEFKMSGLDWNVSQGLHYGPNEFIPFPGLLGQQDTNQSVTLTIASGDYFTGFCIGNVDPMEVDCDNFSLQ